MTEVSAALHRSTRWLIILSCLAAALLATSVVLIYFLFGWHVQQSDAQWCTFYAGVTRDRAAITPAFYSELTRLAVTFGCR